MRKTLLFAAVPALLIVALACSSESEVPTAVLTADPSSQETRPDRAPLVEGEFSSDGIKTILGTGDLGVGLNRFGFVLTSNNGFVTEPTATVALRGPGETEPIATVQADFHRWPYGNRGLYVAWLDFDRPGTWAVDVTIDNPDGPVSSDLEFEVLNRHHSPNVGAPAVASATKTIDDVDDIGQLTTGSLQDPDLYRISLADAVASGRPTVVVFASPAFCTNAVCGPQIEVLQQLKDKYGGQANFVHVDFYDNPHEIQGDLDKARLSPSVVEWGLPSIEWTFVIDGDGTVTSRLEAFATLDEVESELRKLL